MIYEDAAAALNVTDKKWSMIVKHNYERQIEQNLKTKQMRIEKNKAIQDDLRKQIEEKRKFKEEQK